MSKKFCQRVKLKVLNDSVLRGLSTLLSRGTRLYGHHLGQSPRKHIISYLCLSPLLFTSLMTLNVSSTSPSVKTKSWTQKTFIKSLCSLFLKYQNLPLKTQLLHGTDIDVSSDRRDIPNGPLSLAPGSHVACSEPGTFHHLPLLVSPEASEVLHKEHPSPPSIAWS